MLQDQRPLAAGRGRRVGCDLQHFKREGVLAVLAHRLTERAARSPEGRPQMLL